MSRRLNLIRRSHPSRLRPAQWALLAQATFWLVAIRLALRALPFRVWYRFWSRLAAPPAAPKTTNSADPDEVVWAVSRASRALFGEDECFPQALAAQLLFRRRGLPTRLRIGVLKGETGALQAHAWVEWDGKVLVGALDPHLERYTPLPDLEEIEF